MIEIRGFKEKLLVANDISDSFNPYIAFLAINRQAVIDFYDKCIEWQRRWGKEAYGFTITMPCGKEWRFRAVSDIPFGDLPCPCGRPDHYLIKYEEGLDGRRYCT